MRYIPKVVVLLILSSSWSVNAYSESRIANLENIGCTTRQKIEEIYSRLSDKETEEFNGILLPGCTIIEKSNSLFIEKINNASKIVVFFGEDRIELFVSKNFNAVR